jgi:hypothetical protein
LWITTRPIHTSFIFTDPETILTLLDKWFGAVPDRDPDSPNLWKPWKGIGSAPLKDFNNWTKERHGITILNPEPTKPTTELLSETQIEVTVGQLLFLIPDRNFWKTKYTKRLKALNLTSAQILAVDAAGYICVTRAHFLRAERATDYPVRVYLKSPVNELFPTLPTS